MNQNRFGEIRPDNVTINHWVIIIEHLFVEITSLMESDWMTIEAILLRTDDVVFVYLSL